MLKTLTIQNYALISRLEIDFPSGFSVITGETGAGKSILLGALALILGQRADSKSIKQNEDRCSIEGVFDISSYQLDPLFSERGWNTMRISASCAVKSGHPENRALLSTTVPWD